MSINTSRGENILKKRRKQPDKIFSHIFLKAHSHQLVFDYTKTNDDVTGLPGAARNVPPLNANQLFR